MYLKTPFRRRRSIYTHFSGTGEVCISGAGEAGEAGEVFIYTGIMFQVLYYSRLSFGFHRLVQ